MHLLKLAADKDNLDAMYRLGVLYAQGAVVSKDALEAVRLFTKASEAGHAPVHGGPRPHVLQRRGRAG